MRLALIATTAHLPQHVQEIPLLDQDFSLIVIVIDFSFRNSYWILVSFLDLINVNANGSRSGRRGAAAGLAPRPKVSPTNLG